VTTPGNPRRRTHANGVRIQEHHVIAGHPIGQKPSCDSTKAVSTNGSNTNAPPALSTASTGNGQV